MLIEETGSIATGDSSDPDHARLLYDSYTFEAEKLDVVVIEIRAESFVPLLKLVESATGAPLAEWEAEYSDDDALTYTIVAQGEYEARVYALEGGTGAYELTVRVDP